MCASHRTSAEARAQLGSRYVLDASEERVDVRRCAAAAMLPQEALQGGTLLDLRTQHSHCQRVVMRSRWPLALTLRTQPWTKFVSAIEYGKICSDKFDAPRGEGAGAELSRGLAKAKLLEDIPVVLHTGLVHCGRAENVAKKLGDQHLRTDLASPVR